MTSLLYTFSCCSPRRVFVSLAMNRESNSEASWSNVKSPVVLSFPHSSDSGDVFYFLSDFSLRFFVMLLLVYSKIHRLSFYGTVKCYIFYIWESNCDNLYYIYCAFFFIFEEYFDICGDGNNLYVYCWTYNILILINIDEFFYISFNYHIEDLAL